MKKAFLLLLIISILLYCGLLSAAPRIVDRIVAVVGDEIILLSDVQYKMNLIMMRRNIDAKSSPQVLQSLQREVLQGIIDDSLLLEKAAQDTIRADPRDIDNLLNQELSNMKQQYGSEEVYQQALQELGLTERQLRYNYRILAHKNVLQEMLLQNVRRTISVTPQEIENWVETYKDSLPKIPEQFKLSHIYVIPKLSGENRVTITSRLKGFRERVLAGEDFGELARQYSEDPGTAPDGGDLGFFGPGLMIKEFSDVAFALKPGDISNTVETQYGFHIIKVDSTRTVRDSNGRFVDEVKARHILLRAEPTEADEIETVKRLNEIRDKVMAEEATFEDMAKEYSEDTYSKESGGKLQWLTQQDFANANLKEYYPEAQKLKKGDISEPFKTPNGYHLILLEDYNYEHVINVKDDRSLIERQVFSEKELQELQRILKDLRSNTYIDIRME